MPFKLYTWTTQHFFLYTTLICAEAAGQQVEVIQVTEDMGKDKEFLAKKGHMKYPILETDDGQWLSESQAICAFLLRIGGKGNMLGKNAFEAAQIDQMNMVVSTKLDKLWLTVLMSCFGWKDDVVNWNDAIAQISKELPHIEKVLAKGGCVVGSDLTLADIVLWRIMFAFFSFVIGPEQRAKLPATTAWYEKLSRDPLIVNSVGNYHMCAQPWKLFDSDAVVTLECEQKEEVKADDDELDEDDLFGDDDEDDQDARMEAKANAIAAKKGKDTKAPRVLIAKSMIIYEVKPLDSETDLDALAARIMANIQMDGLLWKEQYKKEPVAFGIFKLIIGCTIEDLKVSSDDLQEKIEEFDDMVQSVDISSFNKV